MADLDKGGWVKLNRSIWDNFIWSFEKPQYTLAWIDILLMANYKDKKILFDGKVETVKQGSFITSMVKLSERWKMNRKTVKSLLDLLQSDGMITYETTKRRTTIFVVKYLEYQGFADFEDAPDGQLIGHQWDNSPDNSLDINGTTDRTQHKKVKKIKESKEGKEESTESKDSVCNTDVPRVIEAWNTLGLSKVTKIVPKSTRDTLLNKRIKDYGIDSILTAIEKVRQSDFLKGINKNGWTITFDWFIRPDNFAKVLDGNYDKTQPKPSTGGRKEAVPAWMQEDREQAFNDRLRRDMEQLAEFERKHKTASDDP